MSTEAVTPTSIRVLAGAGVLITVGVLAASGSPILALLPVLVVLLGVAFVLAPLRTSALGLLFSGLLFEDTRARPHMGLWQSPLYYPGRFLYDGIEKTLHVPGLKIFGIELLTLLLLAQIGIRTWMKQGKQQPPVRPMRLALAIGIGTVLLWEIWGIVSGGVVRFSMLQMRPLLYLPTAGILYGYAFRTPRDLRNVMGAFLVAGLIRALLGIYFWKTVLKRSGDLDIGGGNYITSHHDTVLWVTGVVIVVTALFIRPGKANLTLAGLVLPVLGIAIAANNRRLAIVAAVFAFFALYAVARREVQSRVHRLVLIAVPIGLAYTAVAWSSGGMWARPVAVIKSLTGADHQTDYSTDLRDIENYNLVKTLKSNPLIGTGLGHEYKEEVKGIDISEFLEAYRYLPHNSLLWSMTAFGVVGFVLYWSMFAVLTFLALMLYRGSTLLIDQVFACTAVSVVIVFGVQSFGDMGHLCWLPNVCVAPFLGGIGGRVAALGLWPGTGARRATGVTTVGTAA